MVTGRPSLAVGTMVVIRVYRVANGYWARVLVRDPDGRTRTMGRRAASRAAAERALKEAYRDRVDKQILPALGELRLRELSIGTVDRFLKTVTKHHGAAMAKMTRSVLSGMCGLAARHDALDRNPVRDAHVITQPRKAAPKSLSVQEVRQLRALMTYENKAVDRDLPEFVSFMLASGLRIGEASAVTWAAVDLDAGTVEVRGTVIRLTGKGLVLMPTTKSTAGMRTRPLPVSRMTVPRTSTVPASRSTAAQVTAEASPMRRPDASMNDTNSGRSRSTALLSYVISARS